MSQARQPTVTLALHVPTTKTTVNSTSYPQWDGKLLTMYGWYIYWLHHESSCSLAWKMGWGTNFPDP